MKVLIVGSGGREHALAWKAKLSQLVDAVYVAPGNGGTANEVGVTNVEIAADDIDGLTNFAQVNEIDLTIVGPEVPLVEGITDKFYFFKRSLPIYYKKERCYKKLHRNIQ